MTPRLLAALVSLFSTTCLQDSQANLPDHNTGNASAATECAPSSADFQRGVNHAHIHRRGHGYGSVTSAAELDSLRNLGIDWIAIMPYGYQEGATGDQVFGYPTNEGRTEFSNHTDPTLTDDDLIAEVTSAHARGIGVTIKPQIWSHDFCVSMIDTSLVAVLLTTAKFPFLENPIQFGSVPTGISSTIFPDVMSTTETLLRTWLVR